MPAEVSQQRHYKVLQEADEQEWGVLESSFSPQPLWNPGCRWPNLAEAACHNGNRDTRC